MGNIKSYCCKETPESSEDEREEESRIWPDSSATVSQPPTYGTLPRPRPSNVYKIVLPKLSPVEIEPYPESSLSTQMTGLSSYQSPNTESTNLPLSIATSGFTHIDESKDRSVSFNTETSGSTSDNNPMLLLNPEQVPPSSQVPAAVIKEEYCGEQFEYLRSLILKNSVGQKQFKELLWSCIPWSAPGGKSGSTFLKTVNDQFILKEMSKLELQSFLSIADDYFNYVKASYEESRPTLLSIIFGIYKIVYTNSATQTSTEYYFMVMRNLFYKRNICQRFDLKGSVRNRLVQTDDPDNTERVLMDENLLRITCDHPLYISAKSKKILNESIDNDSRFLTSISVMDYSLLVGVEKDTENLILGIIDYVRPFTWDKKLERVVKSVVSSDLPTIVEPELYRERFCEAMDKYFQIKPDDNDDGDDDEDNDNES